jgi:hypothetical protein
MALLRALGQVRTGNLRFRKPMHDPIVLRALAFLPFAVTKYLLRLSPIRALELAHVLPKC